MEKSIKIDGKSYHLVYRGKTARLFRDIFSEDLLISFQEAQYRYDTALTELYKENKNPTEDLLGLTVMKNIGEEFLSKLLWICIKSSNQNKKVKDYTKFVDDIDNYFAFITEAQILFTDIAKNMDETAEQELVETSEGTEDKKKQK